MSSEHDFAGRKGETSVKQEMRGLLLHFGANLWYDEWIDKSEPRSDQVATDYLHLGWQ